MNTPSRAIRSVRAVAAHERPLSVLDQRPSLRDLLDLPSFTDICKGFVEMYRIGLKVFDADGTKLVDIKTGSGDFCSYMFTKTPGRVLCTETVTYIKQHPLPVLQQVNETRNCFSGARYVMAPIEHEGDTLGRVVFGPFLPDDVADIGATLAGMGDTFDLRQARQLLGKIRRAPEETVQRLVNHFAKVAEVLVFTSYRSHLTSQLHIETISESYRELQHKARALEESLARLQQLDRLKSNFLATVSHELRTPLTSVIGYSEMLLTGLAGEMNPEQNEYVSTILEKGESLLGLITSILDLSKVEARGVQLALKPCNVSRLVRTAITTVKPLAQRKQLPIFEEVDDQLPLVVLDEEKIRQCLVNLLVNAVKFTALGGHVTVRAALVTADARGSDDGDRVEISVQDDGIGISPDQHERIFDTFYQVDSSSTREYGGSGLGLSIVRSYVDAHGGEIRIDSDLGQGATFTLSLPLVTSVPGDVNGVAR
jgi:two-component system sensor histidine kinase BarA